MSASRQQIVETARGYIGAPRQHGGRSRAGIDCVGLIICVTRDVGLLPPDWDAKNYNPRSGPKRMAAHVEEWADPIAVDDARPGDLLALAHEVDRPRTFHLAFKTDHGMLHLHESGKVAEHRIDAAYYKPRIIAAWKLRGVED